MDDSTAVVSASQVVTGTRSLRWKLVPVATLAMLAIGLVVIWMLPADAFDRGLRNIGTAIAIGLALVVIGGWYFLLSGVSARARVATAGALLALAGLLGAAVRRVEFTGDMRPLLDFRWSVDRNDAVEQHRQAQAARPVALPPVVASPRDVAEYRGARRDGVVESALPATPLDWRQAVPRAVWRQPVGGGYAAVVAAGDSLFTIEQRRDREAVVRYEAASGREMWVYEQEAFFQEKLGGDGPRATPTVAGGTVYALGATGELCALDATSGQLRWSTNVLQTNQVANLEWGMSGSPLVFDELVVVNPGTQKGADGAQALLALRAADGQIAWAAGQGQASYASPVLVELAGRRQILAFDAQGLSGYDAATGEPLWQFPWKSEFDINASQPLAVGGDRVLISSATGCALVSVAHAAAGWEAAAVWKNRNLKASYNNFVVQGGQVYGLDDGIWSVWI